MRSGVGNAGNVKMRGRKKLHDFECGCCWCADDREQLREKAEAKDMRDAIDEAASKARSKGGE